MNSVADRVLPYWFAATEYATVPLLVPAAADVISTKFALLDAYQGQPHVAVTATVPLPPAAPVATWFVDSE